MAAYAETAPAPGLEWGARLSAARGRAAGVAREPGPWIGTGVALLAAVVVAHHPIARLIGTEHTLTDSSTGLATPAAAPSNSAGSDLPDQLLKAVPTHPPVDPFHPLVNVGGALVDRPVIALPHLGHKHATSGSGTSRTVTQGSAGHVVTYRVKSGDTLTAIAAKLIGQTGGQSWLRWYDANRSAIGANPNLIRTGMTLRLQKR